MQIRVAIVEDDEKVRNSFVALLEGSYGFLCTGVYKDAESALINIKNDAPDVVLMDINLPNMNGIECVHKIKQINSKILIIMITVYDDAQKIFRSLQAGAVGYLVKSSPPDEILKAIREVFNGGSPMSAQIARKVVQSFYKPQAFGDELAKLSAREKEILQLLAKGYLYKEIAAQLSISSETVHGHLRRIYEKLQVHNRTEAVVKYLQN